MIWFVFFSLPLCFVVAWVASQKGPSGIGSFLLSFLLIPLSGLLAATAVLAHDEAHWIERNRGYTAATGQHCCGPQDCYRVPADLFYEDGNVITFLPTQQKFRRGSKGTYLSETNDWWICKGVQLPGLRYPPAVCLFYPFHSQ